MLSARSMSGAISPVLEVPSVKMWRTQTAHQQQHQKVAPADAAVSGGAESAVESALLSSSPPVIASALPQEDRLVFDPVIQCYFDQTTGQYCELLHIMT